eukprot:gene9272-16423_t
MSDFDRRKAELEQARERQDCEFAEQRRVKKVFTMGQLLVRTIEHASGAPLPMSGSTTLVWPQRKMLMKGCSTRRLCVLYAMVQCDITACYLGDAHTTYTADHASHLPDIGSKALQQHLQSAAPGELLMYNEVTLKQTGPILGFALIKPYILEHLELGAKQAALNLCMSAPGTTVVTLYSTTGIIE